MSSRAGRLGGAFALLALLVLVATSLANAMTPPAPIGPAKPGKVRKVGQSSPGGATSAHSPAVVGYRLTANLTPSAATAPATASGHWDGILIHTVGTVKNGTVPSIPGCAVTGPRPGGPGQAPPRQSGLPHRIKCGGAGAVPPFTIPSNGQHWVVGWRLSYTGLSSAVSGADIRLTSPAGAAPIASAALCSPCTPDKFGRTVLTDEQASAIVNGHGTVAVETANNPDGEISGPIVKVAPKTISR